MTNQEIIVVDYMNGVQNMIKMAESSLSEAATVNKSESVMKMIMQIQENLLKSKVLAVRCVEELKGSNENN